MIRCKMTFVKILIFSSDVREDKFSSRIGARYENVSQLILFLINSLTKKTRCCILDVNPEIAIGYL